MLSFMMLDAIMLRVVVPSEVVWVTKTWVPISKTDLVSSIFENEEFKVNLKMKST
jgi:hypothetical protein